jgi:hypothetical protein
VAQFHHRRSKDRRRREKLRGAFITRSGERSCNHLELQEWVLVDNDGEHEYGAEAGVGALLGFRDADELELLGAVEEGDAQRGARRRRSVGKKKKKRR